MKTLVLSAMTGLVLLSSASAGEVDWRQREQQNRIAQGIRSGSITPREAARLETQEARLRREIRRDRSDGYLNRSEYRRINRQENRLSNEIYRSKHDQYYR